MGSSGAKFHRGKVSWAGEAPGHPWRVPTRKPGRAQPCSCCSSFLPSAASAGIDVSRLWDVPGMGGMSPAGWDLLRMLQDGTGVWDGGDSP